MEHKVSLTVPLLGGFIGGIASAGATFLAGWGWWALLAYSAGGAVSLLLTALICVYAPPARPVRDRVASLSATGQ